MKKLMVVGLMALALASCGTSKKATLSDLKGEWDVVEISGNKVNGDAPFIGFDLNESRIYGFAGCNNFFGGLDKNAAPGSISLGALGMTQMMCPNMDNETKFTAALGKTTGYKLDGKETLKLTDAEGNTTVALVKRGGKMSAKDLQGEWRILSVDRFKSEGLEAVPTIWFDTQEGLVHGSAGCNNFNGSYTTGDKQALTFSPLAATRKMCQNMQFEDKLFKAFDNVASFGAMADGRVGLFDENGKMLIELAR